MSKFKGFSPDREQFTRIPDSFFSQLLGEIDDPDELKIILYAFWYLGKTEAAAPYLTLKDFEEDEILKDALKGKLSEAIEKAVFHQAFLKAEAGEHQLYFLNTPLGQSSKEAVENGSWEYGGGAKSPIKLNLKRPNIFTIYENNIGVITPFMVDELKQAEQQYSVEWIEEAINIAVVNNVRKWVYVEAILKSWQEEGRNDRTDQRRSRQAEEKYDPERYTRGKFSDFIKS